MSKLKYVIIFLLIFFLPKTIFAGLTINEIYPAPPTGEYEWIELYNNENVEVELSQYSVYDLTGNRIKILPVSLSPYSFVVATSSSILNNTGDTVYLKNNLGEIIETVVYSGSFSSDKTFAKCPDGDGQWFSLNLVTKNSSNYSACFVLTPTVTPAPTIVIVPTPTNPPTDQPTPTSNENVFLSEVMVNPQTGENEWIELYNDNDFSVTLHNWYIDDLEDAGSSPKLFSLTINTKGFAIFELSSSMFNNDQDSVRLLDFNNNLKDSFEYSGSEKGKSWGRVNFDTDQFCQQQPSKNSSNNSCLSSTVKPTATTSSTGINNAPTAFKLILPSVKTKLIKPVSQQKSNSPPKLSQQVLGIASEPYNHQFNNKLLINLMSFFSFSNSLLTIVSISLKIKIHEGI